MSSDVNFGKKLFFAYCFAYRQNGLRLQHLDTANDSGDGERMMGRAPLGACVGVRRLRVLFGAGGRGCRPARGVGAKKRVKDGARCARGARAGGGIAKANMRVCLTGIVHG